MRNVGTMLVIRKRFLLHEIIIYMLCYTKKLFESAKHPHYLPSYFFANYLKNVVYYRLYCTCTMHLKLGGMLFLNLSQIE